MRITLLYYLKVFSATSKPFEEFQNLLMTSSFVLDFMSNITVPLTELDGHSVMLLRAILGVMAIFFCLVYYSGV